MPGHLKTKTVQSFRGKPHTQPSITISTSSMQSQDVEVELRQNWCPDLKGRTSSLVPGAHDPG
uniref:Uncharacterized protein n=1 Tax=Oryza brachyantha TaxID=4533 RepID=J3N1C5_ORYBR